MVELTKKYGTSGVVVHPIKGSLRYSFALGGDKAYPRMSKPDQWKAIITKSGEDRNADPPENVNFDPSIARHRGVVERVIARIKSWMILTTKLHVSQASACAKLFMICAALSNWRLDFNKTAQI